LDAPIVEIGDGDYALWYRDMSEEPKKYSGKTVRFKGRCIRRKGVPANSFIIGRHIMTCCEADIAFSALICNLDGQPAPENDEWVVLTAKMDYKFHRSYGRRGPVLTAVSIERAEPPAQQVATFY